MRGVGVAAQIPAEGRIGPDQRGAGRRFFEQRLPIGGPDIRGQNVRVRDPYRFLRGAGNGLRLWGRGIGRRLRLAAFPALWRRAVLPDGRRGFGRLGFRARQKTLPDLVVEEQVRDPGLTPRAEGRGNIQRDRSHESNLHATSVLERCAQRSSRPEASATKTVLSGVPKPSWSRLPTTMSAFLETSLPRTESSMFCDSAAKPTTFCSGRRSAASVFRMSGLGAKWTSNPSGASLFLNFLSPPCAGGTGRSRPRRR